MRTPAAEGLDVKLRALKLPSFIAHHSEVGGQAEKGGWNFDRYLNELTEIELEDRRRRRIEKLLKASALPSDKTLATLDVSRLPTPVRRQLPTLCEGGFVDRTENLPSALSRSDPPVLTRSDPLGARQRVRFSVAADIFLTRDLTGESRA